MKGIILCCLAIAILADLGLTSTIRCPSSGDLTYFPDPHDCAKYYECFGGKRYLFTCPSGLYWHQDISECDYPTSVKCGTKSVTTKATTASSSAATSTATTGSDSTSSASFTPDPLCPYPSLDITYFPYPGDCTKYLECYAGVKTVMHCPADLYWNEYISECDYPENVHCRSESTSSSATGASSSSTSSRSSTASTTKQTTTSGDFVPDPYPSLDITYFPYPGDCTKYLECYAGVKNVMSCPPNLYWHEEISECDYPENVDCGSKSSSAKPATSPNPDGSTNRGSSTTARDFTPDFRCPYPSNKNTYYRFPGDCTKYLECYAGQMYLMRCPPDLYWNEEVSECDYPEDSNCA